MTLTSQTQPDATEAFATSWWRGGVIYQIYPRSYRDTTGSGIGDLRGITEKLPYIADLGVDAVWISPFFKSPMKDYGYDVSDYCDIDPMFGTLADFDAMLAEAHRLGLKIMIDLVLSHTSDAHPWFQESRQSRDNGRANWYVWADPKPDGTPPNNWLSIFGGSAWQWDPRRLQYYLHNFLTSQPDLNYHEPAVQDAVLDVARFWLERGVDGFRLDTINFYVHDKKLRDNPPLPEADRNVSIAPAVNPYNHQEHLYSKNQPENLVFLERLRALMDQYDDRACVGEVGDAQRGMELLGEYTDQGRAHMCYAFDFLSKDPLTAKALQGHFERFNALASQGWPCWAFSNHDVPRHPSRWNLPEEGARCYATLLMCLRGTACIYQGEELGLLEAEIPFEDVQDPYGIEFWPEYKGRDGCRTPMVWMAQDEFGGFSGAKPWLPLGADHGEKAVDQQVDKEGSMLEYYRAAIALRRDHPALRQGDQTDLSATDQMVRFHRVSQDQTIFCAFNMSEKPCDVTLPEGTWSNLSPSEARLDTRTVTLNPWQSLIAELQG